MQAPSADLIRRVLAHRRVAVVGLSSNPERPSHDVAAYLQANGYEIVPVNPNETEVLGERAYASLLDVPGPIDIVDVFREPAAVPEIARQAVARGVKAVWLQLGVTSEEGERIVADAGIDLIVDRCLKIEHARFAA